MDAIERKIKDAEEEFNRQKILKEEEELRKLHQKAVNDSEKPPIEKIEICLKIICQKKVKKLLL